MEKLTIVRTNPTQGQPVKVQFRSEANELLGTGEFEFPLWLQFEKLVKDGMEARARVETRETRRIEVSFRPPVEQQPTPTIGITASQYMGGVSNLAMEEEEEGELSAGVGVQPGVQKRLPKSLGGKE